MLSSGLRLDMDQLHLNMPPLAWGCVSRFPVHLWRPRQFGGWRLSHKRRAILQRKPEAMFVRRTEASG
jgi:hypothetical protein